MKNPFTEHKNTCTNTTGLPDKDCCVYHNMSKVRWNKYNQVVQCHNCGHVWEPVQNRHVRDMSWLATGGLVMLFLDGVLKAVL